MNRSITSRFLRHKTPEEIKQEIKDLKKKIDEDRKAIDDVQLLVTMYENARDEKGLKMTEKKIKELEKAIEVNEKKRTSLKSELPPRPLPQPEVQFVHVTAVAQNEQSKRHSMSLPPRSLVIGNLHKKGRS
eukprot:TRINITY_DN5315_c0_g3_i2.p1 TRINITY_DN5315_c0_g3~~TRINITY_DN5315_c0_g3_i2.p1  ORF type:complete len:131 (+),score=37.21 TRINITY_DN5315_c0_g3_i2:655-1047(+)